MSKPVLISSGVLDPGFSGDGLVSTPVGAGVSHARSIAIRADGRIVVAGTANFGSAKLGALQLQPGMQGTVMIKTGERSLLVYLARPLLRRFSTAMSER